MGERGLAVFLQEEAVNVGVTQKGENASGQILEGEGNIGREDC